MERIALSRPQGALARGLALGMALVAVLAGLRLTGDVQLHPNADLYTHLSVARHLAAGDGFVNDITYPLSFAFPFARQLPQPLLQRTPGYALLLAPIVGAVRGDPVASIHWALRLNLLLLGVMVFTTASHLLRRTHPSVAIAWLLTLAASPVWIAAIGRAEIEVACAAIILGIWLELRPLIDGHRGQASGYKRNRCLLVGLLWGLLCLLRGELFWLPPVLLLAARRSLTGRRIATAAIIALAFSAPWLIRNAMLTGNPIFSLQAYAEHLKFTAAWPGYGIYQSLSPESLTDTLRSHPLDLLHKTASGMKYFLLHPARWLPWPLWMAALGLAILPRHRPSPGAWTLAALAMLTLLTYAPFSHQERHLLILYPLLTLEIWWRLADALTHRARPGMSRLWVLVPIASLVLGFGRVRMDGYGRLDDGSLSVQAALPAQLARIEALRSGPLFVDNAAVLWHAGRSGVWLDGDQHIESDLRALVPQLTEAPNIAGLR